MLAGRPGTRTRLFGLLPLLVVGLAAGRHEGASPQHAPALASARPATGEATAGSLRMVAPYANLPVLFVPNAGQLEPRIRFHARGLGYAFSFVDDGIELSLSRAGSADLHLTLQFVGGNSRTVLEPGERGPGHVSYLLGDDPERWRTRLPVYRSLVYRDVWPGVDVSVHGEAGVLSYELVLSPGARTEDIRLAMKGADSLSLDPAGDLRFHTPVGDLHHSRPAGRRQGSDGLEWQVATRFALSAERRAEYGFALAAGEGRRDRVVVQPGIAYATFLGGSSFESGIGIAVDDGGHAYLAGKTLSSDFTTTSGAYDRQYDLNHDVTVVKLNPTGSELIYATFLGGNGDDRGHSLAVDAEGGAYVTGRTTSSNFPTTPGALDRSWNGKFDAFVARLSPDGSALVYSTFLGGSRDDRGLAIAVDGADAAYIAGKTQSVNFPVSSAALARNRAGAADAFVTKLNAAGSLAYSTYLGGTRNDRANGIAIDAAGRVHVAGDTQSADFPSTSAAHDESFNGGLDAFAAVLDAAGVQLVASTYLGGKSNDSASALSMGADGSLYVTGFTASADFPATPGSHDTSFNGGSDAFVARLAPLVSSLLYSTVLGGAGDDLGYGVAVDAAAQAWIVGETSSSSFPVTADAYDPSFNGALDAFLARLTATGSGLAYATYLGGGADDHLFGIALDPSGAAYAVGKTASPNFPTTAGAWAPTFNGDVDAVVLKLTD